MEILNVLDCTLRDGGYCNNWRFREDNIHTIIEGLYNSKVEIIECGFLTNKIEYDIDSTRFTDITQLGTFLPKHHSKTCFVLMINYGEYNINDIPLSCETVIDGLRIAFHKSKRYEAIEFCKKIKEKGYKVFLQPMVTMLYSDEEFKELVKMANEILPESFYIVDSFGTMDEQSLKHYFSMVNNFLNKEIGVGFHSHNNLQNSFANAKALLQFHDNRRIIIDSSIYGMGRGAGNLNSELFLNHLNEKYEKKYDVKPLLAIMDEVISFFYDEHPWGYSLPNYLSAIHMVHPNYAKYMTERKTLLLDDMDNIFSMMDSERAVEYDEDYITDLYNAYMSSGVVNNARLQELKKFVSGRKVLLVAPGRTAKVESNKITDLVERENPIVISINHIYQQVNVDFIFISNIRRFKQLSEGYYSKVISTSNIKSLKTYLSIDYYSLLNNIDAVRDNAGLMAIKFFIEVLGVKSIFIAGMDGYQDESSLNYESEGMVIYIDKDDIHNKNEGMKAMLDEFKQNAEIKFVTNTLLK